ncbi:MAG: winged helix domain-containing protein [Yoonia sp.]|uniref:winged helix domain-containing protein n=1 Tax=Yoonia sp. TaxID=2212373 RepID=UPI003EF57498
MSGGQNETPRGWGADTGRGNRYANAAGNLNLTQATGNAKGVGLYRITPSDGSEPFTIEAKGREAWALNRLMVAGRKGCTPIEQPAPRWSAYVHRLRELGVPIETIWESHGGPYAGKHGRYVLRADVQKGGAA